jgi:hypothetical protein
LTNLDNFVIIGYYIALLKTKTGARVKSKTWNFFKFILSLLVVWGIVTGCEEKDAGNRTDRLTALRTIFAADFPLMDISSGELSNTISSTKYFLRVDYPHYEHNSNVNYLRAIAFRWKRSETENFVHIWSVERINWLIDTGYHIPKVRFNLDTAYLFKEGPKTDEKISENEKKLNKFLASYASTISIYCTKETYAEIMK